MKDIIPAKKQSPILGLAGMGGGVGSNIVAGGAAEKSYVDDVFNTYLYKGNASARTITNGIDLSGEGGLVWTKARDSTTAHNLIDTVRGNTERIRSSSNDADTTITDAITAFNSTGYSLAAETQGYGFNLNNVNYTSWSFRKATGFFDVVQYSGTGSNQSISHNLGCVPGLILTKRTDSSGDWVVYHRSLGATKAIRLDATDGPGTGISRWNDTEPTATHFTLGTYSHHNTSGSTNIAYLFAGGESTASNARSLDFTAPGAELLLSSAAIPSGRDSNQFCLETWLKPDDNSGDNVIYGQYDSSQPGRMFFKYDNNQIYLWQGGNNTALATGSNSVRANQWYHVAWTYDGSDHRLFLNGVLKKVLAGSSLVADISPNNPRIADINVGGYNFDGKLSNFRVVRDQAVYTSSFKPSTEPLTTTSQGVTGSNCKILCCNNVSRSNNDGTGITLSTAGQVVAITDSPFDDPEGFKIGEEGDQNIIKCGTYTGSGASGLEVNLGWEPSWILIKNTSALEDWTIHDSMRGIVSDGTDTDLRPNNNDADYMGGDYLDLTPTGFTLKTGQARVNTSGNDYIYVCIRRPDGYVGKPAEAGTDVFAIDTGNGNSDIPNFDSGFPVDFAWAKLTGSANHWYTSARLIQKKELLTDSGSAEGTGNNKVFDSNAGWHDSSAGSGYISHMWKRHAGFDVVAMNNLLFGANIPHSLGKTPEMIIGKNRNNTFVWGVYHKGVNGGTNPEQYRLRLNENGGQQQVTEAWNNTAPTATHFTVGANHTGNSGGSDYRPIFLLFASVAGISKVGYHTGNGSARTITTGFQPRFLLIKNISTARDWYIVDTTRGWGSGDDLYLSPNTTDGNLSFDFGAPTSTGFTLPGGDTAYNANGENYIYYAHA